MSNFTDILTGRINLKRRTQYLLDSVVPASSMSFDRQPSKSSRLVVNVSGATVGTGVVNISGDVNETINFDDNKNMVSENNFTSLSGLTLSGISGGNIEIYAANSMGEPITQEYLVEANVPVRFYPISSSRFGIARVKQGDEDISQYNMMVSPDQDIEENDLIYAVSGIVGLTIGLVSFVKGVFDFDGATHHLHCEVKNV